MKAILLILACALLTQCVRPHGPKPQTIRTTTYHNGAFGASPFQSVTETPFESPAYRAAGEAMFTRP